MNISDGPGDSVQQHTATLQTECDADIHMIQLDNVAKDVDISLEASTTTSIENVNFTVQPDHVTLCVPDENEEKKIIEAKEINVPIDSTTAKSSTVKYLEEVAHSLISCCRDVLTDCNVFVRIEKDDDAVYFGSPNLIDSYNEDGLRKKDGDHQLLIDAKAETDLDVIRKFVQTVTEATSAKDGTHIEIIKHEAAEKVNKETQTIEQIECKPPSIIPMRVKSQRKAKIVRKLGKKSVLINKKFGKRTGRPRTASLHSCTECDYMAPSISKLTSHMNKHRPEDAYKCAACDKIFKYERLLFMHYEKSHEIEMSMAGQTNENQSAEISEKTHKLILARKRAEEARPFKCSDCDKRFKTQIYMTCHYENKHGVNSKNLKKDEDGSKIVEDNGDDNGEVNDEATREHDPDYDDVNDEEDEEENICGECGMVFSSKERLNKHRKKHAVSKRTKSKPTRYIGSRDPIYCPHCGLACDRPSRLKRHIQETHERVNSYSCNICGKGFRRKYHLDRHTETHSPEKDRIRAERLASGDTTVPVSKRARTASMSILCEQCGFVSKSPANLRLHVRKMHDQGGTSKKYECEECGHLSKSTGDMARHKMKHSNEKPFTCEFCGQCFKGKYHMKRHQNVVHHQGVIKRYPCPNCQLTFTRLEHLRRHQSTHQATKPYNCRWCSQTFARMEYVKVHERRHTGEKPYSCQICSRGFYDASSLRKHEKGAHQNSMMHTCLECGKRFFDSNRLLHHGIKYHTDSRISMDVAARSVIVTPPSTYCLDPNVNQQRQQELYNLSTPMERAVNTTPQPHSGHETPTQIIQHDPPEIPISHQEKTHHHTQPHTQHQEQAGPLETIDTRALHVQSTIPPARDVSVGIAQHMCVICGQQFPHQQALLVHMRMSHEENFVREIYSEPHHTVQQTNHPTVMMYSQGMGIPDTQAVGLSTVINAMTAMYHNQSQHQ